MRDLRCPGDDEGFTLVESMVAMVVAALMFGALSLGVVSALRATVFSRQNQQASDLLTEYVETTRNLSYGSIANDATGADFAQDTCGGAVAWPCVTGTGAARSFDPDGSGPLPTEPIYAVVGAAIVPHIATGVVRSSTSFTLSRFVTQRTGDPYRRLTVVARWSTAGQSHQRITSTKIVDTRRGLPLPKYTWQSYGTPVTSVPRGTRLTVAAALTNRGAKDRWNLAATATSPGGTVLPWTWTFYLDADGDGVYNPTVDVQRLDPDANGNWDSGLVSTDGVVNALAVTDLSPTETVQTVTVKLSALSASQPGQNVQPDVTSNVAVTAPACGCTYRNGYLHNWGDTGNVPSGSTTAAPLTGGNTLNTVAPPATSTVLYDYDSDLDPGGNPGRLVRSGGAGYAESDKTKTLTFQYTASGLGTFSGTAFVQLYGVLDSLDPDAAGSVTVLLRGERAGTTGWTNIASATLPSGTWGTSSYKAVDLALPILLPFIVNAGQRIELSIQVPVGSPDLRIAYDTAGFRSVLSLPYILGNP
jgi:prepilin-type N-terminal cleavage/methylation domain-containing protein